MKTIQILTTIILLMTTFSCQEVVDVDLETSQERLVIEALINWDEGTVGNEQTIKLTKTSSFYNNIIQVANGAIVKIINTNTLEEFLFNDMQNGIYFTNSFVPILNDIYRLEITYLNETYISETTLLQAPEIVGIDQTIEGGFTEEEPEVNVYFQDFIDQEDYYRVSFKQYRPSTEELVDDFSFIFDSRFEENNVIQIFYENSDFEVNDEVEIKILKITKQFFNYVNKLEQQADAGIGPFASPPVNVKGNVINQTLESNYPYGYFNMNKVNSISYVFQ